MGCPQRVIEGSGRRNGMAKRPAWLDEAVFYEIYPQSFKDTDGDGIGNFDGIVKKVKNWTKYKIVQK